VKRAADTAIWPAWNRPGWYEIPDPSKMTDAQVAEHRAKLNIPAFCQALAAVIESSPDIAAACHNRLPSGSPSRLRERDLG
jgi:hypothetical protein